MARAIECLLRGCRRARVRGVDETVCVGDVCLDASAPPVPGALDEVIYVEHRPLSPTCACGQPTAAVRLTVGSIGMLEVDPLCTGCRVRGQNDPAGWAKRFVEVATPREFEHIQKHAPRMAAALERVSLTVELGEFKEASLAFDELSLEQVAALAKGLSEPSRETLAAFLASATNV